MCTVLNLKLLYREYFILKNDIVIVYYFGHFIKYTIYFCIIFEYFTHKLCFNTFMLELWKNKYVMNDVNMI